MKVGKVIKRPFFDQMVVKCVFSGNYSFTAIKMRILCGTFSEDSASEHWFANRFVGRAGRDLADSAIVGAYLLNYALLYV